MIKTSIRFFDNVPVRSVWDEESSRWWLCAVDIIRGFYKPSFYKPNIKKRFNFHKYHPKIFGLIIALSSCKLVFEKARIGFLRVMLFPLYFTIALSHLTPSNTSEPEIVLQGRRR